MWTILYAALVLLVLLLGAGVVLVTLALVGQPPRGATPWGEGEQR